MSTHQKIKLVHEGRYVAEVTVEVDESEQGWSPTISLEDAYKLDDVMRAFKAGDLKAASQYGRVYKLGPVISAD